MNGSETLAPPVAPIEPRVLLLIEDNPGEPLALQMMGLLVDHYRVGHRRRSLEDAES